MAPTATTPASDATAIGAAATDPGTASAATRPDLDAIIIGAGFSGMYMLKSLRDRLGLRARVIEAGDTVGGTWYWNRYPGAKFDSESYIYQYLFDEKLYKDWQWSERFPGQPEIEQWLH